MRVTLNLASRPYVELRPLYQRLRVIIAVLAVLAVVCWYVLRTEYAQAKAAQARVDAIQSQVAAIQSQRQRYEADMRQPKNAAVLDQAKFLNNLFLKKAFSWTAVMIDLERVLPAGVQVLNIDPQVAKDGHVTVRLRILGPHDRAVDVVRNLERSRRFLTPRLTAESAETSSSSQNAGLQNAAAVGSRVNFDIVADYNPLPVKPVTTEDAGAAAAKPRTLGKSRRRPKPSARQSGQPSATRGPASGTAPAPAGGAR